MIKLIDQESLAKLRAYHIHSLIHKNGQLQDGEIMQYKITQDELECIRLALAIKSRLTHKGQSRYLTYQNETVEHKIAAFRKKYNNLDPHMKTVCLNILQEQRGHHELQDISNEILQSSVNITSLKRTANNTTSKSFLDKAYPPPRNVSATRGGKPPPNTRSTLCV